MQLKMFNIDGTPFNNQALHAGQYLMVAHTVCVGL